jgi:hypothetical protein
MSAVWVDYCGECGAAGCYGTCLEKEPEQPALTVDQAISRLETIREEHGCDVPF